MARPGTGGGRVVPGSRAWRTAWFVWGLVLVAAAGRRLAQDGPGAWWDWLYALSGLLVWATLLIDLRQRRTARKAVGRVFDPR
ncbi:hypothetical protein [Peterkaempfera griseoplana]|uniref:hypothetical protein n=1 Tax=Peterkaempfera griseoplana TaxID=66896 RepID=UPI0006E1D6CA|nr:hypothetical protein [Peterkaempfera griseoplana]